MTTASLVRLSPAARALLPVRATTRQVTDRQLRAVRTRHPSVTSSH
jgi:hypothetical protein